jgi:hypothetical protein
MTDEGTPLTDDPTRPRDGLDPGEEHEAPAASRHHGGVKDPAHPDFFTVDHRYLDDPSDPLAMPERRQVVDDHLSQTVGAGAATQAEIGGVPGKPGETRPDTPGDPRADLPVPAPDST